MAAGGWLLSSVQDIGVGLYSVQFISLISSVHNPTVQRLDVRGGTLLDDSLAHVTDKVNKIAIIQMI